MREIKFRAWDNEEQKMLYEMYVHCEGMPVNKIFTDNWDYTKKWRYVWMQYTGLKDRNWIDVYDGDVLKILWNSETLFMVFWSVEESGFQIRYFEWMDWVHFHFNLPPEDWSSMEIVGNMYESPILQPIYE